MSEHLTQDELLQYKFGLIEAPDTLLMRDHLDDCQECNERLAKLDAKFASLDELRDDGLVGDALEAKTIAGAAAKAKLKAQISKRQSDFPMPVWMQGVAAVLVAGLLSYGAYMMLSGSQEAIGKKQGQAKLEIRKPKSETIEDKSQISNFRNEDGEMGRAEQAPFAPASAIELNVLPKRQNVQLTIYNSADLTLVRESRNLTLKKGWNWLQLAWANTLIDPTSLSMEPKAQGDKIKIQQLVYPARVAQTGRWLIHSEVEGQVPFEITYFTSGVKWRAFYMGTLSADESQMRLEGYVRVDNGSGEEYADAQTRLIVGAVHQLDEIAMLAKRQYPYGRPGEGGAFGTWYFDQDKDAKKVPLLGDMSVTGSLLDMAANKPKEIVKEGLSEYFLYTIEGTETIADGWGKRLPSFAADGVKVSSLYKYDEERWGAATIRYVSFVNDEEHKLGATPIPDGMVRIYGQASDGKGLAYVGGTGIKYIPVTEKVELNLGEAKDVVVEPKLMNFATENIKFGGQGNVRGWDEVRQWQIELRNTRAIPVEVEVMRGFATPNWDITVDENTGGYEKYDATHAKFTVKLGAGERLAFTYTVRTYNGTNKPKASEQ